MARKKKRKSPEVGARQELWLAVDKNYTLRRRAALLHDLASTGDKTQVYLWRMAKSKTRPFFKPGTILHGTWMVDKNPRRRSWRSPEFVVARPTNLRLGVLWDVPGYQRPEFVFRAYWSTGSAKDKLPENTPLPFTPHWYPLTFPRAGQLATYEQRVPVIHDVTGETLEVVQDTIGWRTRLAVATQDEADRSYNHLLQILQDHSLAGHASRYRVPEWGHWVVSYRAASQEEAGKVREFLEE